MIKRTRLFEKVFTNLISVEIFCDGCEDGNAEDYYEYADKIYCEECLFKYIWLPELENTVPELSKIDIELNEIEKYLDEDQIEEWEDFKFNTRTEEYNREEDLNEVLQDRIYDTWRDDNL